LTATGGWYFTVARAPLPGQAPLLPRGLLAAGTKISAARPGVPPDANGSRQRNLSADPDVRWPFPSGGGAASTALCPCRAVTVNPGEHQWSSS